MNKDINVKYKEYLDYVTRCEKNKWLPASPSEEVQQHIDALANRKKEENTTPKVFKKIKRKSIKSKK
jgi:hypothetical protein